jgi:hypothetical protein
MVCRTTEENHGSLAGNVTSRLLEFRFNFVVLPMRFRRIDEMTHRFYKVTEPERNRGRVPPRFRSRYGLL